MTKKTIFALCLLAAASPSRAGLPIEPWAAALSEGRVALLDASGLSDMKTRLAAEVQGSGQGQRCLEYGDHTQTIPPANPLDFPRSCLSNPLPDDAATQAAFSALVQKIRREGGPEVPYKTVLGDIEYQQGIGMGNTGGLKRGSQTLIADGHWGDAAILELSIINGVMTPVGVWIYTFRAYTDTVGPRTIVKAERALFHAYWDGKLSSISRHEGEVSEKTGAVMWPPMPRMDGPGAVSGMNQIYWRQLLRAWTR